MAFDRRGGVLVHGPTPAGDTGPSLVLWKSSGARDRNFSRVAEDPKVVPGSNPEMEITTSGEIVTVSGHYRYAPSLRYSVEAVIHRDSPAGESRGTHVVPLPGEGYSGSCGGKCGYSPPSLLARILPTGAVLIVGGVSYTPPSPYARVTRVDASGNLDANFGGDGHVFLPNDYNGYISALRAGPNGEVWTVVTEYPMVETRLVRLTSGGEFIRGSDGSIGPVVKGPQPNHTGRFDFFGSNLLEHQGSGDPMLRQLVVRRGNLKF